MILRRVMEQLRQQHWTAIAIDLVIVVLGVFIGMQVSNWNQQRVTDRQAAVFTAHLKADLREEDWRYQFLVAYNREVLANANRAVNVLDGTNALPDEELLVSAYRATQYKQGLRRRSTGRATMPASTASSTTPAAPACRTRSSPSPRRRFDPIPSSYRCCDCASPISRPAWWT